MKQQQTVLIVDDDTLTINMLASALSDDYRVLFATSGEEALKMVSESQPDLIILDIVMPGIGGYETMQQLHADKMLKNIPVVFLTSKNEESEEAIGLEMGAIDYWVKPFNREIVRLRTRNHLELKRHRDTLAALANLDGLTGIVNRRGFDQALITEWRRSKRTHSSLSLLLIDIDHFKAYNDAYGHIEGDTCLRFVADTLTRCLNRPADLVCRYGGEEFVCILPDTDAQGAEQIANTLREAVETSAKPHASNNELGIVTISVGAASTVPGEREGSSELDLLKRADDALYAAKDAGRNTVRTNSKQ